MPDINDPEYEPNRDDSPESLEAKLHAYHEAIQAEFKLVEAAHEDNAEDAAIDFAKKNLPNNLAQVQWLACNSTSDAVRANCAKYMITLAREDANNEGDPIKKLLKKLTAPAPASDTAGVKESAGVESNQYNGED